MIVFKLHWLSDIEIPLIAFITDRFIAHFLDSVVFDLFSQNLGCLFWILFNFILSVCCLSAIIISVICELFESGYMHFKNQIKDD